MNILLRNIIKEINAQPRERSQQTRVQIYCDADGVLVDMDGGFMKISGNRRPYECEDFWKIVGGKENFWVDLEPLPHAEELWRYLTTTFTDPSPIILSAGQKTSSSKKPKPGLDIVAQKKAWVKQNLNPQPQHVIIAPSGAEKRMYAAPFHLGDKNMLHILIDDDPVRHPRKNGIPRVSNEAAWRSGGAEYRFVKYNPHGTNQLQSVKDGIALEIDKFLHPEKYTKK